MEWCFIDDGDGIITAKKHIASAHVNGTSRRLPETCVIFEMGSAIEHIETSYDSSVIIDELPCFLEKRKCVVINDIPNMCYTKGGYGSPACVDTLETVLALGSKRIIVIGMCGVYGEGIDVGDVVIPHKILSEEGTSRHYLSDAEYAKPDENLFKQAVGFFRDSYKVSEKATVTTDAVYRQTFKKESFWRNLGCVGVDMEASALLNVCRYYGIPSVAILLASDKHPLTEDADWKWGDGDFGKIRRDFIDKSIAFSKTVR